MVVAQAVLIARIVPVVTESLFFLVEPVQATAAGAYPDRLGTLLIDRRHVVVAQAVRVAGIVSVTAEGVAASGERTEPATIGSDPQVAR